MYHKQRVGYATYDMTEWYMYGSFGSVLFGALAGNFVAGMGLLVGRYQAPGNEEPAAPGHFIF